jgi:hypothetical protein
MTVSKTLDHHFLAQGSIPCCAVICESGIFNHVSQRGAAGSSTEPVTATSVFPQSISF